MENTVICKDAHGNEYQCLVDDLDVRIGVYAVLVRDGKVLLARHWGGYSMIGGGVEKGESLEDAFVREVKEETGMDVSPGKLIHHATTFFRKDEASRPKQSHQFYFTHSQLDGKVHNSNITDSEKGYTNGIPEWFDLNKIDQIDFRHSVDIGEIVAAYRMS